MIRLIASCLWISVLTAGAGYVSGILLFGHAAASAPQENAAAPLEYKRLPPVNVPMIADGAVQGYVVAQLGYTYNRNLSKAPVPPDAYLTDEAFREIYSDKSLDFRHLEKFNVAALTKRLVQRVNERLKMPVVKDVLIQQLNFFPKADISR